MAENKNSKSTKLSNDESKSLKDFVNKVGGKEQAKAVLETLKQLQKAA